MPDKNKRKDVSGLSDDDRIKLLEISFGHPHWECNPQRSRQVLLKYVDSLQRDNYGDLAAAFSRFLLDEVSLNQAFGIEQPRRGRPPSKEVLARDVQIIRARDEGKSWKEIADDVGIDERDAQKLYSNAEGFERRFRAAVSEILGQDITD